MKCSVCNGTGLVGIGPGIRGLKKCEVCSGTGTMRLTKDAGVKPILCNAGCNAVHHHFWGCPRCGSEVGGFIITGSGEDDWGTHKDKFCKECGQKIDWNNTEFSSIYRS